MALTWLDNLVGAGIAGDEPTHALPYGQVIVATLAGAATLLLDREALLVLLAGPKPASTHLVSRAGPAPYGHLHSDHPPGKRRAILTDGAALGSAGKVLRAPLPSSSTSPRSSAAPTSKPPNSSATSPRATTGASSTCRTSSTPTPRAPRCCTAWLPTPPSTRSARWAPWLA